ncbi:hypothetical protein ACLB2K_018022 [Fragaria x ananassa]
MNIMFRALIPQLLISILIFQHVCTAVQSIYKLTNADCDGACDVRCGLSSRPDECKRACGTCCARCGCVPPGTSGHYEACPCYWNMTTHGGRRKCP